MCICRQPAQGVYPALATASITQGTRRLVKLLDNLLAVGSVAEAINTGLLDGRHYELACRSFQLSTDLCGGCLLRV